MTLNTPANPPQTAPPPKSLQERAEEITQAWHIDTKGMTAEEVQKLVDKLRVHQLELEMQNKELRRARAEVEQSRDRFADVNEFAPIGYIGLNQDAKILEANLAAATLLGVERPDLLQASLLDFIPSASQEACRSHCRSVLSGKRKRVCELEVNKPDGTLLFVRLESMALGAQTDRRCWTALIDLTADRHTLQQLRESEQHFRRLVDAVTDYVYHVRIEDGQPVATLHSEACEAVTGYRPEEFGANPLLWIDMVPPPDRNVVQQQAAQILAGEVAPRIEHRIRRKDGQIRWILNTASPQHDSQGRLTGYDGLIRDITERKQAEEALQQLNEDLERRIAERTADLRRRTEQLAQQSAELETREREFHTLADNVPALFSYVDREKRYRYVNRQYEEVFQRPAGAIVGKTAAELLGRQRYEIMRPHVEAALQGKEVTYEADFAFPDGPHTMQVHLVPDPDRTNQGHVQGLFALASDITEQKRTEQALRESEERIRAIVDTAVEGIVTIDEQGRIESINPAALKMFGYAPEEVIGQNVRRLMASPHREAHDSYLVNYLETGEKKVIGIGREVEGMRRNGEVFLLDLAVTEVMLGGRRKFAGFLRDSTERMRLQKEILEISEREQSRIGQDLHDGLCQHLAGIEFRLLGLRQKFEGKVSAPQAETSELAKLVRQAIEQTRTLARGLSPVTLEERGLMAALQELAINTAKAFNLSCSFNCPTPVSIHDNVKATHLYRMAQEAVHNAIRHGRAKTIRISLLAANDRVVLTVRDDGIGLPKQPLNQDGMGLRIMHYRAGMVGGSLQVRQEPEGGTSVVCSLRASSTAQKAQRN